MNPNREELSFQLALLKPVAERRAWLDRECGDDQALRTRIEVLLTAHEQPEGVLAETAPAAAATMKLEFADVPDETVGQKIGRYKILEKVGEGGCGVVYVAEQTEPVRRRVALKVIKLGMDTKAVVARFEAERQALAMMDHPNIAKVLDAGTTETGRPYFIMELVRGIKITDYCDQEKVSTHERLELFIQICQAIQHAHQKGIIHRDIKPSNILVTLHDGVPVPKVIDFGIAKATEGRLTDKTIYTQLNQFIGTPAYMSPEQAEMSGLDIDTRSDIYSLGVLLYELLTGKTPFDAQELMSRGIDAMRKTIREKDPVRPSTKLATLQGEDLTTTARRRSVESSRLAKLLKGDLDWIVMKCLEKDRTRRYETANGLAMDIQRHFNSEPVVARPPSKLYEFRKTVRRHKVGFAATAAIVIVLAAGVVISSWQAVRATRAEQEQTHLRQAAEKARESEAQQRREAETARANETQLREQAQAAELAARQLAYASDMNMANLALNAGNLGRAQGLLDRQRPKAGQRDLRGWEWRYLWGQCRGDELFTLTQMPAEIYSLAVSADGQWLAGTMRGGAGMQVWNLRTRREAASLTDVGILPRVAISPTEPLLAVASTYGEAGNLTYSLRLWDIESRQFATGQPLAGNCAGLAFSEDGRRLVVVTEGLQDQITVWAMPEGKKMASHAVTNSPVASFGTVFAATRKLDRVAYATGFRKDLHVLNLKTGTDDSWEHKIEGMVNAMAFSDDGSILALGTYDDGPIYLFDTVSHREIGRLTGNWEPVTALVFWPDGRTLASTSTAQTVRLWDVKRLATLTKLRGHHWEVWRAALLPDHRTLVTGCKDGTIKFWDTAAIKPRLEQLVIPIGSYSWRFDGDGDSVLGMDGKGIISRWEGTDYGKQRELVKLSGTPAVTDTLQADSVFSQDGKLLATRLEGERDVQIWDVERGAMLGRIPVPEGDHGVPMSFLARGGKLLVYTARDQRVHEWDLKTWEKVRSWPGPPDKIEWLATISRDERFCLLLQPDGEFCRIYDLINGGQSRPVSGVRQIYNGAFAPDGDTFAICSALGFVSLRETATLKEIARFRGFAAAAFSVAFSLDGRRLLGTSGGGDAVKLWDLDSRQEVLTLEADASAFYFSAFSADNRVLAALGSDKQLQLWRAPSWEEINAAEAENPSSPDYGTTGRVERKNP